MTRKTTLYDPGNKEPFKLSRSKVDLFLQCPRCFYLDRKLGVSQPSGAPYTLNNAVDALLKNEFDQYRKEGSVHPFIRAMGLEAIPFSHPEMETWRNNRIGVQYHHLSTNFLLFGAIDDLWQLPSGELTIVDYKAKATTGKITLEPKRKKNGEIYPTDRYLISYINQVEFYQWLFRKNGFLVSKTNHFVFANASKEKDHFGDRLDFEKVLITYEGDDSWIEPTLTRIKACLDCEKIPDFSNTCSFCQYNLEVRKISEEHIN